MADIFDGVWVPSLANIIPSGASKFQVKVTGDAAYYDLGAPRDIALKVSAMSKDDSLLRASGYGFALDLKIPSLQAGLLEIEALANIVKPTLQPVLWQITELDGKFLKQDGTKSGIHWVLKCGGKMDDYRMIDYTIVGNLAKSELDAVFSDTGVTVGTPASGDTLYTLTQNQVPANQKPNGLTKVEFKAGDSPADSVYATLGDFSDNKCDFSCLFELGGGGRQLPRVHGIKLDLDVTGIETSLAQKQLMDLVLAHSIDLKLTFQDGIVCILPNTNVGVHQVYGNVGNADKVRTMNLIGNGAVFNWNGTNFFATDGTTTWAASWT